MGKHKKQTSSLGKTIIKDRFGHKGRRHDADSYLHTSELQDGFDWGRLNLQSVTEQNTLDDFLATAELAGTEFQAEKLNVKIVHPERHTGLLSTEEEQKVKQVQDEHKEYISIPRRPDWDDTTTAEELDQMERDGFLNWRRKLAELQEIEGLILTPFERNLDFWRQLWRVIERSDVVVQIVDARNPLMFRCEDLEKYVHEVNPDKVNVILLNKADHLTVKQRQAWAEYFDSQNIKVAFWSAVLESERNKEREGEDEKEAKSDDEEDESDDEEDMDDDEELNDTNENTRNERETENIANDTNTNDQEMESAADRLQHTEINSDADDKTTCDKCGVQSMCDSKTNICAKCSGKNSCDILNGDDLLEYFRSLHNGATYTEDVLTLGLVGYPNVGKSSTINALLQTKKVPVSATPGRTKHFQTLYVEKTLLLCDCPGLVMPTFVNTKADMILNGILPIDQMRDFVPPVSLLCKLIPRSSLEATYGVMLRKPNEDEGEDPNRPPTAWEFMSVYGAMRGFMTHKGVPDFQRSARVVLKDYVNGKLLFCHPPPGLTEEEFGSAPPPKRIVKQSADTSKGFVGPDGTVYKSALDRAFFSKVESRIGSKGKQGVSNFSRAETSGQHYSSNTSTSSVESSQMSIAGKPWKKHGNKNKKEKLRRKNQHLDVYQ